MYFVDRSKVEQTLLYLDKLLNAFEQASFDSLQDKLSLERIVHMIIESILDVGNMMIDGFIMRDPGSYEDIIDILVDEKVIPIEEQDAYKELINLRQMVVREYLAIEHVQLIDTMNTSKKKVGKFSSHVTHYLNNELGVANTFSNEEGKL